MNPSFKSVLSTITSLTPPPSSDSPYSLSALIDSPASGEKHSNVYPVHSCEYDTDSPSCYDSDSLLDFTTSSYLESIDSLDTSVSWYCRGDDNAGSSYGDEDSEMHISLRSGQRTPLSPTSALDSPPPLLDSKVFILRPVRLLNDDFDFTCAGPEEASSLGVRVRYQLHHPHHHHHHHHHTRRHKNANHNHTTKLRPPKPELEHQQPTFPLDSDAPIVIPLPSKLPKLQSSTIDYSKRRWSAPGTTTTTSPHSSMLTRATTTTGTTILETPLSLSSLADSYPVSSSISQDPSTSGSSKVKSSPPRERTSPRGRQAELQMYTISDAQNQILMSKLKSLQISSSSIQPIARRKISSSSINGMDTPTPRTWPYRRQSDALHHLRSGLPDSNDKTGLKDAVVDAPMKKRSQTMHLFCASNKWGNQPPDGYI